jgi:hypothetical protein
LGCNLALTYPFVLILNHLRDNLQEEFISGKQLFCDDSGDRITAP